MQVHGEKRQALRQPVLRSAKISFNGSIVDCLVLDVDEKGMRVSTEVFVKLPGEVSIELRTGGVWVATTRWQRGLESGLEFVTFAGVNAESVPIASRLYEKLRNAGVVDVTDRLAAERYFDHPGLRDAAIAAKAAIVELETMLRIAAGRAS